MRSYHFDIGNSSSGPIGLCARGTAPGKRRALELLREALGDEHSLPDDGVTSEEGIEYLRVYFNGDKITTRDIDDEEAVT